MKQLQPLDKQTLILALFGLAVIYALMHFGIIS